MRTTEVTEFDDRRELLVAGHVNVDWFLRVDRFPATDRTAPVVDQRKELGGTAANLARVGASLGVRTGLATRLGDGFPTAFEEILRTSHIDLRGVERVPGLPTPTCFLLEDTAHATRTLIEQGPMGIGPTRPALRRSWLGEYAWVHLTTGPPAWGLELAAAARRAGLRVAVDPAQEVHYRWDRAHLRRLLASAEILFGNRSEIDRILELLGVRSERELLEQVPLVIRTEGRNGAVAFSRTGTVTVPATRPHRVVTMVGAGEAFRGGFYAAWFAGEPLRGCLGAGTRSAARWIEGERPQTRGKGG